MYILTSNAQITSHDTTDYLIKQLQNRKSWNNLRDIYDRWGINNTVGLSKE